MGTRRNDDVGVAVVHAHFHTLVSQGIMQIVTLPILGIGDGTVVVAPHDLHLVAQRYFTIVINQVTTFSGNGTDGRCAVFVAVFGDCLHNAARDSNLAAVATIAATNAGSSIVAFFVA